MQNGLNIRFVTKDEFTSLKGVKPESLEIDPGSIEDTNLVRAYNAEHSVIKSKANGDVDNPVYTTRAQACTAGFLRVRVGMEPQSHMMLHLLGIKKDDLSPVEQATQALPEKLDEFFDSLDDLIRLAIERNEKIYIDHVAIGSIEQSVGELPEGVQCEPLSAIKANSGDLRRFIEESVNRKVDEVKKRAKASGVEVDFSESSFTGQTSIFTGEHPEIPMSHMHYDPGTQTLSINADYYTQIIGASTIHGLNVTDAEAISRHYAKVLLGGNHKSTQANEAEKYNEVKLGFSKLTEIQRKSNKKSWSPDQSQALWDNRYSSSGTPYSMNGVYAHGQISTGVGNNSTYITIHNGEDVIGFAQDESGAIRRLASDELAEKKLVGPTPQNGYFFTRPRDVRQIESSGSVVNQAQADEILNGLADDLVSSDQRIAFYSGAGISVAAGIDDINAYNRRTTGGVGDPLSLEGLQAIARRIETNPDSILNSVKEFFQSFYLTSPTLAHEAIADLSVAVNKPLPVFTENLDLLHQKTGINVMPMKPANQMKPYLDETQLKQLDCIVCTGLSHDDRGFIAYLRELNPGIKIIANALPGQRPDFIDETNPNDIFLAGNAHEVFPRLARLVQEKQTLV